MLQTRKLPNGTIDVRCSLCGYNAAVLDLSVYRCLCSRPAVEASLTQAKRVQEDVGEVAKSADVEETPKPKRRRRKKPVATES